MKKILLLALSQLLTLCVWADGFPRYYELVTRADQLESGKYYVIIEIPTTEELEKEIQYRMAYNGINTSESKGNVGSVTPNELYAQDGIEASKFSGIIDIEKAGNAAKPLKMTINTTETSSLGYTVWNFVDESVGTSTLFIGTNASISGDSQHYLIGDEKTTENNIDNNHYHLWTISVGTNDNSGLRVIIRNVGKTYYLKYDANSYGAAAGLFRVYASTASEKRNVMLYKEMETVDAKTSSTGHGTLYYSNKVLMVPEGVTAKTYTLGTHVVNSKTDYETERFIPANSAVVLHGTASTTYTFPVTTRHEPTRDDTNILRGFDEAGSTTTGNSSDDANYYFYKLTTKNGANVGFYWGANNGAPFTSAAHKAFLAVNKKAAARIESFLLDDSETPTSITPSPNTQHPTPDKVFDLSGRRVSTSQSLPKGIYISNGKKFVVK